MSIDVREATVAAVIAGAVVVILGYASGFGLQVPLIQAATVYTPAPVVPLPTPPAALVAPGSVGLLYSGGPVGVAPVHTYPIPTPRPPVPSATPTQPALSTCSAGLLGGLLEPVGSLVDAVLGGGLLAGGLLGGATAGSTSSQAGAANKSGRGLLGGDLLGCGVSGLLGSSCCSAEAPTSHRAVGQ
jgi:hypothetical protein